jgi:hypothetical protein
MGRIPGGVCLHPDSAAVKGMLKNPSGVFVIKFVFIVWRSGRQDQDQRHAREKVNPDLWNVVRDSVYRKVGLLAAS